MLLHALFLQQLVAGKFFLQHNSPPKSEQTQHLRRVGVEEGLSKECRVLKYPEKGKVGIGSC